MESGPQVAYTPQLVLIVTKTEGKAIASIMINDQNNETNPRHIVELIRFVSSMSIEI